RRRHTIFSRDWSSDVCSSDLGDAEGIELKRDSLILIGALGGARAASIALGALSDDCIAAEAEEALAMLGPSAVPLLVDHAGSGDAQLRARCVELLGRLADDATRGAAMNAIVGALGDSSVVVLAAALGALASVGDASCLRPVVAWLSARNTSKVRKAAEKALAALARRHPAEAKQLAAGCTPSGEQAFAAAVVIAALGSGVRLSVPRTMASSPTMFIRWSSLRMSTRTVCVTARSDASRSTIRSSTGAGAGACRAPCSGTTLAPAGTKGGAVPTDSDGREARRGISSMTTLSAPREPMSVASWSREAINRSSSMLSMLVVSPVGK